MEPVISPIWFYLIHVASMIHVLSLFVLVISIAGLVVLVAGGPDEEENRRITKKYVKTCIIAIIICSLVVTLVPNARTVYMMLAASVVTPDNIVGGEEHIVNLITNIVTAINNAK
jgi:hypothetical protein